MVFVPEKGVLVTSYVRLPGSGHDRSLPSKCLDLGKVSTVAASVPVSAVLPQAIAQPRQQGEVNEHEVKKGQESEPSSKNSKPPQPRKAPKRRNALGRTSEEQPSMKRARHVIGRMEQGATGTSSVVIGPPVRVVLHLGRRIQLQTGAEISSASVTGLQRELSSLRSENASLNQKLSLFKQLFRDKKKLALVIQQLGVVNEQPSN